MPTFANDIDLIQWEPNIMIDAASVAQTVLTGSGDLSGTTFTLSAGSLTDAHITNDHVIVLSGSVAGSFPIFSVDTSTVLKLSVLYEELEPAPGIPWSPSSGTGLGFVIRTFWSQRKLVTDELLGAAGVEPVDVGTILNPDALRRPCALGVLKLIYTALAAGTDKPEMLLERASLYEQLYRRAFRNALLEIDRDGDGRADQHRSLAILACEGAEPC